MESFGRVPRFIYNPSANQEPDHAFSGLLGIHVHHARNLHNICIYDNQDVYAKFSLTYNPDETLSTRIIYGGGKNPEFNEDLILKINQADAVLKCEIWMMSRAKNFMDDQLLGFALVPISTLFGKGKVSQDLNLSSTDLFHSPAGTIKLSLSLNAKTPLKSVSFADPVADDTSAASEPLMDQKIPEYTDIEFPDISIVNKNQQMVTEYFAKNGPCLLRPWLEKPDGSFLHLGAAPQAPLEDYEMAGNTSDEYQADSGSQAGSIQNSGFLSSTMTSLSDDRNSADSKEKKSLTILSDDIPAIAESKMQNSPGEPGNEEESKKDVNLVRSIKIETEESVMQQQIVDMYMKSTQHFTESLAKMKLPMDLDKVASGNDNPEALVRNHDKKTEIETATKKDNSRVFYGSRAFF